MDQAPHDNRFVQSFLRLHTNHQLIRNRRNLPNFHKQTTESFATYHYQMLIIILLLMTDCLFQVQQNCHTRHPHNLHTLAFPFPRFLLSNIIDRPAIRNFYFPTLFFKVSCDFSCNIRIPFMVFHVLPIC